MSPVDYRNKYNKASITFTWSQLRAQEFKNFFFDSQRLRAQ
jgi:hypothetical protein